MKLKKSDKLVVSKKMFASTKTSKKKDFDEKPKKKRKKSTSSNVSPKKTVSPKKKQTTPRSKTASAEKDSLKTPTKTKTGKNADKNLSSPSPTKSPSGKSKNIDWAELGVQRCTGCNFTTNEEGIFSAHLSLCRLYNKHKIKSPTLSPNKKKSESEILLSLQEKTPGNVGKYVSIPDDRAMMLESYREDSSNKPKSKSLSPSPTKKKQANKSDILVNFVEKQAGHLRRMVSGSEKQAVIQEPYLEGSSPAQTVFLFRCYHCRSYFINIQTLKDHHRMAHGSKNLTVSLVPFTDDEPPEDINKKIIVDASRIVPTVNYRKEINKLYSCVSLQTAGGTITSPSSENSPPALPKMSPSTVVTAEKTPPPTPPLKVVSPPMPPKTAPTIVIPSSPPKTVSSTVPTPPTPAAKAVRIVTPEMLSKMASSDKVPRNVTVLKKSPQEVRVQVSSSSDKGIKGVENAEKKGPIEVQRLLAAGQNSQSNPKVVLTPTSSANQSTANKMVVLNLIPKSQSVACSPVQIEIPANSPLNTHEYLKQIPNLAKAASQAIQTSQEGSKNWAGSTKNKTILPKSILMGVRQPPIELPLLHPTSKIGLNPGITVISSAQKIIQSADGQFTNTSALTSAVSSAKQSNRKIILFPLTSNASSSGSVISPGTTLTATPAAAAITTSAVVTCATTTSPSMATPLASSLAGPSIQTTVSPVLISSAPALLTSNGTVVPSVWVVPSQPGSSSKLSPAQVHNSLSKQPLVSTKAIQMKPTTASTKLTQSSSTSISMTTQSKPTVLTSSKTTSPKSLVTITPVSEALPTAAGMSLLENVAIVKSNSNKQKKMQENSDTSSLESTSPKQDKAVKGRVQKTKTSPHSSTDNQTHSKSILSVPPASNKRKIAASSDVSVSIASPSPKKKAHISSQTSISKSQNPNSLESAPSLSTSSKSEDNTEDFTLALVTKKKGPVSVASSSAIKKSLSKTGASNSNPLVIVRKSVGSNKLIVHTMVSANKLFQIQGSNILSCSLCTAKINRDLMRNHLYWHFHVENRNSTQCSLDHRCHYCSVIDYVISMIPKNKPLEKPEDISSRTSQKTLGKKGQSEGDVTISHDSHPTVECSGDSSNTEPLGLKISSTFSLRSKVPFGSSEEESEELPDIEPEEEKPTKGKKKGQQSSLDVPKSTSKNKVSVLTEERSTAGSPLIDVENTDTRSTAGSPLLDVENIDERSMTKSPERSTSESPIVDVENLDEPETVETSSEEGDTNEVITRNKRSKDLFKTETPSQAEKNTIYKGNFYICGFKECTYSSLGIEEFKDHQENKHAGADGYSCVHCQLECLEPEVLVHHMETHLCGDMFIHYRCAFPECNFGTNLMKSFMQHNIGAHPGETVFLCYYCNANFQGCAELHKHLRANLLKYVHCPHCSVRNGVRDTILSHIKSDHPDKPRRIFVTGQMVCHQKQKVLNRSMFSDYESDSSGIDSDCMIVDDEILDRHLIKQTNVGVHDIFEKSSPEKEKGSGTDSVHPITISDRKNSGSDDESSDCVIVDDSNGKQSTAEGPCVPEKTSGKKVESRQADVSVGVDGKITNGADLNAKSKLKKSAVLKKNEGSSPKKNGSAPVTVVTKSSKKKKKDKSSPEDLADAESQNTDKEGSETEESSAYLRVKKVAHTYSRKKKTQPRSKQQQLEDSPGADKDKTSDEDEDTTTSPKSSKRRILIRNKPRGRVDVGTPGLDSILSPLYLHVGNELHCRICTFKCVPLQKMHSHILLMHLHVFLYECRFCHKTCSCKIEMTEHCDLHGHNNRGFANLPEPDWDQVIRSLLPATFKASNLKSVTEGKTPQTSPTSDKDKSTKPQRTPSPKKSVTFASKRKSLELSESVSCKTLKPSTKENSSELSSSSAKTSSNEDRNIFSLFSFGLESEPELEETRNLDSGSSSKQSKLDSNFSRKLFTLPNLPSSDKTPIKYQSNLELPRRTPTPEGHDRITVAKEQYMKELHLISISKVSHNKQQNKRLSSFGLTQLSKYPNTSLARLRSWRTALKRTPTAPKAARTKKSKKTLPSHGMLITPKTAHKKVVPKTTKLKVRKVQKSRSSSKGHLLRSATKLRHSPRTLRSRLARGMETRRSLSKNPEKRKSLLRIPVKRKTLLKTAEKRKSMLKIPEKKSLLKTLEKRKSILKTPEKHITQKRSQNLRSSSPSLSRKKTSQPVSSKSKVNKRLDVNPKKVGSTSQKLMKASLKTVQKKNLTISHGQQSIKKALNQASRNSASAQRKARLLRRKRIMRKISASLNNDTSKSTDPANCLFFSCSWCQFKVSDREHFQRHISLHNFFPQGCKMYCPYCSYTTPNALVLEKHIPMHMDKHPFGCRHCGFSAKSKMMVVRHCKRSHPEIPVKLVNRSTSTQKLKPSWPVVSFSPKVRLKKCTHTNGRFTCSVSENKQKDSRTKKIAGPSK